MLCKKEKKRDKNLSKYKNKLIPPSKEQWDKKDLSDDTKLRDALSESAKKNEVWDPKMEC